MSDSYNVKMIREVNLKVGNLIDFLMHVNRLQEMDKSITDDVMFSMDVKISETDGVVSISYKFPEKYSYKWPDN